ncbi:MAG: hypothetical protein JWP89_3962 [Schlesneria sp.]|nr:hypothetical protein [Schlesneria sp.]
MVTPTPVRSGFRVAGQDAPSTIYAHPPLVESWLGVDFATPVDLASAGLQALRVQLGPEWLNTWKPAELGSAKQLTNVMGDRALRLTPQGFAFGWLGYSGERYPRYESIRDGFVSVFTAVQSMGTKADQPRVPHSWSVCYLNRIPQGTVWSTAGDWGFFSLWQPVPLQGLGIEPTGFRAEWELPLEAERGTLKISFQHRPADETENIWINLTARGPVEDAETGVFDGLDYGREVIVRSFNDLVSPDAKKYWGVQPR